MENDMSAWCQIDLQKMLRSGERIFELDIQLEAAHRRITLTGPSGIGKTMILRALAGLVKPDAGRIAIHGSTLFDSTAGIDLPAQQRHVGFMFQDYALLPHLTALGNVGFGLRRGVGGGRKSVAQGKGGGGWGMDNREAQQR